MSAPTIDKRAAHVLDGVILALGVLELNAETDAMRAEWARHIATCERFQADFAGYVELVAIIDRHLQAARPGRDALVDALGADADAPTDELCEGAAAVIRYATEQAPQGQEVQG